MRERESTCVSPSARRAEVEDIVDSLERNLFVYEVLSRKSLLRYGDKRVSYETRNITFCMFPFEANFVTLFVNLEFMKENTTKTPEVFVFTDFFSNFELYLHKINFVYL